MLTFKRKISKALCSKKYISYLCIDIFAQKQLDTLTLTNDTIVSQYNYALSQVFGASLVKKLDDPCHEESVKALLYSCKLYPEGEPWNFVKGLEVTYNYLRTNYRCEYVYMNEIANQLLLKYHSDNSATLLKELASDSSIADIVIVNGSTVAYEIKTELDTFDRLDGQLESYQRMFDSVYVVTHANAVDTLSNKIDKSIGIIVMELDGTLKTIRTSGTNEKKFDPEKAVLTLRQSELVAAYEKFVHKLPQMGTALIHEFCLNWYLTLERSDAHTIFYEALKSRKPSPHQFQLIRDCNASMKMLFLGRTLSKKYCTSATDRLGIFGK